MPSLRWPLQRQGTTDTIMSVDHLKVPIERLAPFCDPSTLGFHTTAEVEPLEGTIGQERAISALEMGLEIEAPGFNVFVSGALGSGRSSALRSYLDRIAPGRPNPPDWGYVHNFQEFTQPVPISLPCGMMRELRHDMDQLIETCRARLPNAFESDDYTHRVEAVMAEIQQKRQAITEDLEFQARARGFAISSTQVGITPVPLHPEGRPLTQDEFGQISGSERDRLRVAADEVQRSIALAMSEYRRIDKEANERRLEVDADLVRFTLTPIVDELQEKYADHSHVVTYLDDVEADMVVNTQLFKPVSDEAGAGQHGSERPGDDFFARYRVNDLVDNTLCNGAPVEFEENPSYYNLFGRIDYRATAGLMTTDHTMIRPGAIHRANGGYLVVQARDLLKSGLAWDTLKRVLRSGEIMVENIGEQDTPLPTTSMRPQPIPVSAKIVLVGTPGILSALRGADEDFRRYFKVTAEFDRTMERTSENIGRYVAFVASELASNGLRPFDSPAVAAVLDHSSRLVDNQTKLATRFMSVSDVLTESDYWAGKSGCDTVGLEHVEKALQQREYRVSLGEERLRELIDNDTIRIDTQGEVVGQLNGLAVYSLGEHSFGRPSRVSARVSVGTGRVINIDRETRMSGRIHNKGFLILNGYLQGKYGRNRRLSMSASITFEQSYSQIEGDSASSTELYALLSALSGLPIRQGIAVTGSVNQAGEVQAIGGATYKIEGFYKVCKARGLTGSQGVMIPKDNVRNLVLNREVVDAVEAGQFHIYAVSTIDEGIEVLTGVEAGELGDDGEYPNGTVHHLVERQLSEMSRSARRDQQRQRDREPSESDSGDQADESDQ